MSGVQGAVPTYCLIDTNLIRPVTGRERETLQSGLSRGKNRLGQADS